MAAAKFVPLNGAVFSALKGRKNLLGSHWLDTDKDRYYKVIQDIVIPSCMEISLPVAGYKERIKQLISTTTVKFNDCWSFTSELLYKAVADKSQQTEENITKVHLIRAANEMLCSGAVILDDIVDEGEQRWGEKSWHLVCPGGSKSGIFDALLMYSFPTYLIGKYFRDSPARSRMLDIISMEMLHHYMGQTLDNLNNGSLYPSLKRYTFSATGKTSFCLKTGTSLALLHAGVTSEEILKKTKDTFHHLALAVQIWDDFNDYYCTSEQTGKIALDFQRNKNTWVSATAVECFNEAQAAEFKECYGSSDPKKIARVLKLFDEVDITSKYIDFMRQSYNTGEELIRDIPDQRVANACFSYMDWLIGHVPVDVTSGSYDENRRALSS